MFRLLKNGTNAEELFLQENKWENLFLVFSNLFMYFPIRWAYKKKLYIESMIFSITSVASIIYHSMGSFMTITGEYENTYNTIRFFDFFTASNSLVTMSAHLINYSDITKKYIHIIAMIHFIIIFLYYYFNNLFTYQIILVSIASTSILLKPICTRERPQWSGKKILITIPFVIIAVLFFGLNQPYWLFHSLWHIFIMMSIYYGLNIPIFASYAFIKNKEAQTDLEIIVLPIISERRRHRRTVTWG